MRRTIEVKSDNEHRYKHVPKLAENCYGINKCKLTELSLTKPDIIIHDNEEGTRMLIDVAVPRDENEIKEGAERIS
jgi:hypothetical protein